MGTSPSQNNPYDTPGNRAGMHALTKDEIIDLLFEAYLVNHNMAIELHKARSMPNIKTDENGKHYSYFVITMN